MQAARQALAPLRRAVSSAPRNVRNMSGGASIEEEIAEMKKWRTITFVAIPICAVMTFKALTTHHEEEHEKIAYPYLRIRNKEFPWGPNGLFEHTDE